MNKKTIGGLALALVIVALPLIAEAMKAAESWGDLLTPQSIGALLAALVAVVVAWATGSPFQPKPEAPDHDAHKINAATSALRKITGAGTGKV